MPMVQPNGAFTTLGSGSSPDSIFSPDGSLLYAVSGNTVNVFRTSDGTVLQSFSFGTSLGRMDISPSGTFLALVENNPSTGNGTIYRLSLTSGLVETFSFAGVGRFYDLAILADGRLFVTQAASGPLRLIDLNSSTITSLGPIGENASVSISSDNSYAVALPQTLTQPIHSFDLDTGTGRALLTVPDPYAGASVPTASRGVGAVSPDGSLIYFASSSRLYSSDLQSYVVLPSGNGGSGAVFSPDGSRIYVVSERTDRVSVIDVATRQVLNNYDIRADVTGVVELRVSDNGTFLSITSSNGIQLINLAIILPDAQPTTGDDTLFGNHNPEAISGLDGADIINGEGGDDSLFGNEGNDTLNGGGDDDLIAGGDGADLIDGGSGNDRINGGADNDVAHGGDGNDVIVGGDLNIGDGADTLFGDNGNDMVNGGPGGDIVSGGDGNDFLFANAASQFFDQIATFQPLLANIRSLGDFGTETDMLTGGAGDDQLFAGFGDGVDGGTGTDTLYLTLGGSASGVTADFRQLASGGTLTIGGQAIQGIENVALIDGTEHDDVLTGSDVGTFGTRIYGYGGNDQLIAGAMTGEIGGGAGDDIIDGRAASQSALLSGAEGNDTIYAGAGAIVYGGSGNDTITGSNSADSIHGGFGIDNIDAGGGNDLLYIDDVGEVVAGDQINGGAGFDTLVALGNSRVPANIAYDISAATLVSIEQLGTTSSLAGGPQRTIGLSAAQLMSATTIAGQFLLTTSGSVSLTGIGAADSVFITLNAGGNAIDLTGFAPSGELGIGGGEGNDTILGTASGDSVNARGGNDVLYGYGGADDLIAGDGNDMIDGGADDDSIDGQAGDDLLTGCAGIDLLTGGDGNDIFRDTRAGLSGDSITDLSIGDRIVFTDATLAGFTFDLSGSTLTYTGGSLTVMGGLFGQLVASAAAGGGVQLVVAPPPPFATESLVLTAFGYNAGGWTSDDGYPRRMADVNGDGRADVVGFGNDGVFVALGNAGGSFAPSVLASVNFGHSAGAGGWASDAIYPRQLADVNGDNRADIVAFGEGGTYVALANANGTFGSPVLAIGQFGRSTAAGGWTSNDVYHRELGDVNGDNRADIIGFGNDGVYVALANANGTFAAAQVASVNFGYSTGAGGWTSDNIYPRRVADVNGDNRVDIVAFGEGGTYVALGQANGTFAAPILATGQFGHSAPAGGWTSNDVYYRELADVNGDGRADIVGFGLSGTYLALGQANGTFAAAQVVSGNFGAGPEAGGWANQNSYPRHVADIDNDGFADIVGFGANGVYVAHANADYWL